MTSMYELSDAELDAVTGGLVNVIALNNVDVALPVNAQVGANAVAQIPIAVLSNQTAGQAAAQGVRNAAALGAIA